MKDALLTPFSLCSMSYISNHRRGRHLLIPLFLWFCTFIDNSWAFLLPDVPSSSGRRRQSTGGTPLSSSWSSQLEATPQRPQQNNHSNMGAPKIITCSSSKELTHAVSTLIQPHHIVAELGSQLRDVSQEICKRCQYATLVDVQRDLPKSVSNQQQESKRTQAMRIVNAVSSDSSTDASSQSHNTIMFQPNAKFSEINQLSDWRQAFFSSSSSEEEDQQQCYDVFVLDVNAIVGNDLEWTALDLILEFESMSNMMSNKQQQQQQQQHDKKKKSAKQKSLKYVLVKSLGLNRLASQLTHTDPWLEERSKQHEIQDRNNDRNRKRSPEVTRYVATVGVKEYRQTIPVTVDKDDFVLEVGCHFGTSTEILHQYAKHCIGADVGSKIIKEAQIKFPHVFFRAGNAWKTAELLRLQQEYYQECNNNVIDKIGFDVVYVDVGGLSSSDGLIDTLALVSSLNYAFEPRAIVIKSLCLQRLAIRFTPYWRWQKKEENKSDRHNGCTEPKS